MWSWTKKGLWVMLCGVLLIGTLPLAAQDDPPIPTIEPAGNPADVPTIGGVAWDWPAIQADTYNEAPDPLTITVPSVYAGDLPTPPLDLSQVRFVEDVQLNEAQLALLSQNGFVVVPSDDVFFENTYYNSEVWGRDNGQGFWVTTDALLNGMYIAFENLFIFLEQNSFYVQMRDVVNATYASAVAQQNEVAGTPLETPAQNAVEYLAVALGLFDSALYAETVAAEIKALADPMIALALSGEGTALVPFVGQSYQEDFSQYKPRGHYTTTPELSAYFRGMMWLGRMTFLVEDDAAFQTSLLLLRALLNSGRYEDWKDVAATLDFLVGPMDNFTPLTYENIASLTFGAGATRLEWLQDPTARETFKVTVLGLPGPQIHNVIRPLDTTADALDGATRGFRFFGQRFTFDGYALQRLIYPEVGVAGNERALPTALDVAAVMGSETALNILQSEGAFAYENYGPNLADLRTEVSQITADDWLENIYGTWLWALQPLWVRNPEAYPALMNTEAWWRKDLQTGLSSYTELKHATILYTVQPMGGLGGGGDNEIKAYGYVEPNPLVFARIAVVSGMIARIMEVRGYGAQVDTVYRAFKHHAVFAARMADMAARELRGEALTPDDYRFLERQIGSSLFLTRYFAQLTVADPPELAALVTDIASNVDAGTVLQVGTGKINYIYVVTDSPNGLQLTRGGVYSFYEFVQPINERLTDEEWRAQVEAGNLPPRPAWISAFYAE